MKRTLLLTIALLFAPAVLAQEGEALFQQALLMERSHGDLVAAVAIYEQIVAEHSANRSLAARTLVHLGRAYERLGNERALQTYQRVVADFSDQPEMVAQAAQRIRTLQATAAADAAPASRDVIIRKVREIDNYGAVSPDGRFLTYVDWESANLALYDLSNGQSRLLSDDGSWEPDRTGFSDISLWSPDGRTIAYYWFRSGGAGEGMMRELRLVEPATGQTRVLLSGPQREAPWPTAWMPDGRHLLAVGRAEDSAEPAAFRNEIVLVDVRSGEQQLLKRLGPGEQAAWMDVSPDGRFIAYELAGEGSPQKDIHILSRDGSVDAPLIVHAADNWSPRWSVNGRALFFASDRTGAPALWIVPVADGAAAGTPRLVVDGIGQGFRSMGFTRDGTLYYASGRRSRNVFTAPFDISDGLLDVDARQVSLRFDGSNRSPFWSPDGTRLAYLSDRHNETVVVVRDIASGSERELPLGTRRVEGPSEWAVPHWAADGEHLLLSIGSIGGGGPNLYLVHAETGERRRVASSTDQGARFQVPMPDGRRVLFMRGPGELFEVDLATGAESRVHAFTENVYRPAVSPDGSQLVYFEGASLTDDGWQRDLAVVSLIDGARRVLWETSGDEHFWWNVPPSWFPDGRHVMVALRTSDGDQQFYRVAVDTGERTVLTTPLGRGHRMQHARLSADGRSIAFQRGGGTSEVWAIENLPGTP